MIGLWTYRLLGGELDGPRERRTIKTFWSQAKMPSHNAAATIRRGNAMIPLVENIAAFW